VATSKRGKAVIEVRAESGTWVLFFDVAAVALTASGQSFTPSGAGSSPGTFFGWLDLLATCLAWQLSPALTVCAPWLVECALSAPTAMLLQPRRHPPAIQIETVAASTDLSERNGRIWLAVYSRALAFVENHKTQKRSHRIAIKTQHFCNGELASLVKWTSTKTR